MRVLVGAVLLLALTMALPAPVWSGGQWAQPLAPPVGSAQDAATSVSLSGTAGPRPGPEARAEGALDGLPGVLEARRDRIWVSGSPLIRMGLLEARSVVFDGEGGGGEGGGGGRALELSLVGAHCRIYVDSNCVPYPSQATLVALATEFDEKIWPNVTDTFGGTIFAYTDINIVNIDGPYGIGGYFTPADPDALYVDCADINSWGYQITAHEFQHLIHNQKDPDEELWVNEGCADMAIAVIYGVGDGTLAGHVDGFESRPDNDLTVFRNEMCDYGSAYAFVQYFWDHFGGRDAIRELVAERSNGIQGINSVLEARGYSKRFDQVFREWCVANRVNDPSMAEGQYGYVRLSIRVNLAADHSSLPVQSGGEVQRWASDCSRFRGGDGLDLLVEFCATSAQCAPLLYGLGRDGADSVVLDLPLNSTGAGSALLRAFGVNYSEALLFTPASAGGSYSYQARLVDRTPPVTSWSVLPPEPNGLEGWYVTTPQITLRASEEGARTYFRWDDGEEESYSSPLSAPEGEHLLRFHSVDAAGNSEGELSLALRVDTTPPEALLQVIPENPDGESGWYITPPTVSILTEPESRVLFSWDGGELESYTSPLAVPEGRHRLEYFATDRAGNEGPVGSREFQVDASAPLAVASLSPASPDGLGGWYITPPTLELRCDESGARLFYSIDGGGDLPYARPLLIPEGAHRVRYWARDQAGNLGPAQELLARVDSLAPEVSISMEPALPDGKAGWYRTRPTVTLAIEDADPGSAAYYAWDGAELRQYYGPLRPPEGLHTLRYLARDTRGNAAAEQTRVIRVDTRPPVTLLSISPEDMGEEWYRESPQISLVTDEGGETWYWWDGGPPRLVSSIVTPPEGEHVLNYYSRDAAGNAERQRSRWFRVDIQPPVAVLRVSSRALLLGDVLSCDASESEDANGVETYLFDFGDGVRRSGAFPKMEHQYEAPGNYTVTLKVRDTSGSWSDSVEASVEVSMPPRPPAPRTGGTGAGLQPSHVAVLALLFIAVALALFARRGRWI
ncbi:MAG: PKD domain-containing protein [Thermoplasmatota archaeon]